jgi:hypothetical protein
MLRAASVHLGSLTMLGLVLVMPSVARPGALRFGRKIQARRSPRIQ